MTDPSQLFGAPAPPEDVWLSRARQRWEQEERRRRREPPLDALVRSTLVDEQLRRLRPRIPAIRRDAARMEEQLRHTPVLGELAGVLLGLAQSLERMSREGAEGVESLADVTVLMDLLGEALRLLALGMLNPTLAAQDAIIRFALDPEGNGQWQALLAIGADIEDALAAARRGDHVDASAGIVRAAVRVADILSTVEGAVASIRNAPNTVKRLGRRAQQLRRALRRGRRGAPSRQGPRRRRGRESARAAAARLRARFRRFALARINGTPNHPLKKLVNPRTGRFRRPRSWRLADLSNAHAVVAGHVRSDWMGGRRLALEDAYINQYDRITLEGLSEAERGAIEAARVLDIGGVPVEWRTAMLWEREGVIPRGTVRRARPHPGWSGE